MTGIKITTNEEVDTDCIDPVIEVMLNNGVFTIDNGLNCYTFKYAEITKIEFYEYPESDLNTKQGEMI